MCMNDELYPYQKKLIMDIESFSNKGEMTIMMAGRQTGKSMVSAVALRRLMEDLMKAQPISDIQVSTGTILGARYHTAEPIGGDWAAMLEWCTQTYGEPAEVWNIGKEKDFMWPDCGRWYANNRRVWFRDEKDLSWFLIRWRA